MGGAREWGHRCSSRGRGGGLTLESGKSVVVLWRPRARGATASRDASPEGTIPGLPPSGSAAIVPFWGRCLAAGGLAVRLARLKVDLRA
jgi:hypothetical protein